MKTSNLESIKERVFSSSEASSEDLKELLEFRKNNEFDFLLIDIREIFEYTDQSINGTDLLFPTTTLNQHIDELEKLKDKHIVLYCRTGSRTSYVLGVLKQQMGFTKIAHLSDGIYSYRGDTSRNARIPNKL
ncbi:MAG: rhodanese-like domain-containing protein [Sulfurospirillaceae bacterium]|nr:rhodanese-like domain-containing protein [Sulfurospirillaceae bacterium]